MIPRKQIALAITDLEDMKETHEWWATYFEADPETEKEYVATGEWDDAKGHRKYVVKYKRIINLIKRLSKGARQ